MATVLAEKLRMAATALGCRSRKELCARFRDANPATRCELEPLNKWMQGRSLPRSNAVYADFAAVIGTTKSGSWITDCSIEEFAAELAACTGVQSELLIRPGAPARRVDLGLPGLFGGITTLAGAFAAYSPAWSPHYVEYLHLARMVGAGWKCVVFGVFPPGVEAKPGCFQGMQKATHDRSQ